VVEVAERKRAKKQSGADLIAIETARFNSLSKDERKAERATKAAEKLTKKRSAEDAAKQREEDARALLSSATNDGESMLIDEESDELLVLSQLSLQEEHQNSGDNDDRDDLQISINDE
jgi:hypothetical protein